YDWIQPYLSSTEDGTVRDKLATLADELYSRLDKPVSFADFQGREYPAMGIVGCVLSDYTNPNNLSLSSTPSDWYGVGTEYLFVSDPLHGDKALVDIVFDGAGKFGAGMYKFYWVNPMAWWFQVYSHFTGRNIFDDYPMAEKIMTNELWDALPNRYNANYGTLGNVKLHPSEKLILNLLDAENKSYALKYIDELYSADVLPYSGWDGALDSVLLYLTYDDYSGVERKDPPWTSHFDSTSFYQVFRGSWQNDSDWLSLITWPEGFETRSNRDMAHHDQLSFEYYSRGDLLLADGGETKHVLDKYYGSYDVYHNTVLIEDPRTPFDVASWSDSRARGMYKGDAGGLYTPAYIKNLVQTPWMEAVVANATIHRLTAPTFVSHYLSSPINYERAVLFPNKEYFVIIDRLEGDESWIYRSLFRPTSLNITPTAKKSNYTDIEINASAGIYEAEHAITFDSIDGKSFELKTKFITPNAPGTIDVYVNGNHVGSISFTDETSEYYIRDIPSTHLTTGENVIKYKTSDDVSLTIDYTTITVVGEVKIDLLIGDTPYDWLSLPYKTETPTGATTNSIKWTTTNPYGREVEARLFSAPASEILVTKHVTRIAGYTSKSEVFLPLVYFRSNETQNLYRITVLLARYPTEEEKNPEEIPVAGEGTAVRVTSLNYTDYIYSGDGESSFGDIATNARTLFLRKSTQPEEYTFMEGSYVSYSGSPLFEVSSNIDYLALRKTGENITFKIKGTGTVNITLYQMNPSLTYQVKRDGTIYSNWVLTDDGRMIITTSLSEHTFEIETTTLDTTPPTITNVTITNITTTSATITWQTDEPADSLVKYGTSPGNYEFQKYNSSLTQIHSITLTNLSAGTTYYFVVNSTDASGNSAQSPEYNFTTPTEDKTPPST
ncbi:MAG: N-acetylneuraminic acid mutarotase, partial [Candidatus Alkanophagales archaeon MCA70_species_2]|nr:N-acetylneuraminic acid mutarotase [Candidatus Alkanophaga liquidiphilum]